MGYFLFHIQSPLESIKGLRIMPMPNNAKKTKNATFSTKKNIEDNTAIIIVTLTLLKIREYGKYSFNNT